MLKSLATARRHSSVDLGHIIDVGSPRPAAPITATNEMGMLNQLPPTIVEFIDGVNAFDIGRIRRLSPMTLWLATITANSGAKRHSVGNR